jgi:arginyl-tRNA synthetase
MDIFQTYRKKILAICTLEFPDADERSFDPITAEPPKDSSHGDVATNAAMVLAKPLGQNPRAIAEKIAAALKKDSSIEKVEIAGPGFINLKLKNSEWLEVIKAILSDPKNFGRSNIGNGEKVNVEYVSANPTGPMHIGHARNAVLGDALATILQANGYDVTKEYYINDAGAQVNVLAESVLLRYREALGENIGEIPSGLYPGEYLIDVGQKLKALHGDALLKDKDALAKIKKFAIAEMMVMIKNDLAALGVEHDIFTSEAALHEKNAIQTSVEFLNKQGLVYRGVLEPPKGKTPEDWEPREQLLFRSTQFGDDVDRPLQKSDGQYTYFSGDIAYHKDKIDRGFNKMVIALGADHGGYVKRLTAIVKALSNNQAGITVLLSQLVNLVEDGQPVKMSKRAGNFITMRDVLDRVGKGVVRFIMLTRKADAVIDFDLKKVLETTKENPVFYVQYANARICSALRAATEQGISSNDNDDMSVLTHPAELELIRKIAEYPRVVKSAAIHMEPHRIPFYLHDLASVFHQLWNIGADENIKFIDPSNPVATKARLNLIKACSAVISSGLNLLKLEAVERM